QNEEVRLPTPATRMPGSGEGESVLTLISEVAVRIGAILILIFLVRTLFTLYRYNTRLAAYYDGKADVLQIVGDREHLLPKSTKLIVPESIAPEKQPPSPTGELLALIMALEKKVNRLTRRKKKGGGSADK